MWSAKTTPRYTKVLLLAFSCVAFGEKISEEQSSHSSNEEVKTMLLTEGRMSGLFIVVALCWC